jgi:hypothetical protein
MAGSTNGGSLGTPDPAKATGNEAEVRLVFADAPRMLTNRINIFISLPIRSLDQLALQTRLDAIAQANDVDGARREQLRNG